MRACPTSGVTRRQFFGLTAAWLALTAWTGGGGRRAFAPPYKAWRASETAGRAQWAG